MAIQVKGLRLVAPCVALKDTYLDMINEWQQSKEQFVPWVLSENSTDFPAMVTRLADYSRGILVPEGFVPHSTYWLVRGDDRILGAVNLRHYLNDHLRKFSGHIGMGIRPSERGKGYGTVILRLTLDIARRRGIKKVLMTCDTTNIASARAITRNGGVLDSEDVENSIPFQRYWIALD